MDRVGPSASCLVRRWERSTFILSALTSRFGILLIGAVCLLVAPCNGSLKRGLGEARAADLPTTQVSQPQAIPPAYLHDGHARTAGDAGLPKVLAINLDTIFRLAEEQNAQVALARARVQEACAEKSVAGYG